MNLSANWNVLLKKRFDKGAVAEGILALADAIHLLENAEGDDAQRILKLSELRAQAEAHRSAVILLNLPQTASLRDLD